MRYKISDQDDSYIGSKVDVWQLEILLEVFTSLPTVNLTVNEHGDTYLSIVVVIRRTSAIEPAEVCSSVDNLWAANDLHDRRILPEEMALATSCNQMV